LTRAGSGQTSGKRSTKDAFLQVVGLQRALMATQLINLWAAAHFCLAARCLREEAAAAAGGGRERGRE
jgi:hypothetical protein